MRDTPPLPGLLDVFYKTVRDADPTGLSVVQWWQRSDVGACKFPPGHQFPDNHALQMRIQVPNGADSNTALLSRIGIEIHPSINSRDLIRVLEQGYLELVLGDRDLFQSLSLPYIAASGCLYFKLELHPYVAILPTVESYLRLRFTNGFILTTAPLNGTGVDFTFHVDGVMTTPVET